MASIQSNNVLYQPLWDTWNGYRINTDFRVGIQIIKLMDDKEVTDIERTEILVSLLFGEEDGSVREHPPVNELEELLNYYMGGWCLDNTPAEKQKKKLMDYDVDQWRIYADFRSIYGINLNEVEEMHWWEFQGLLWNMPNKLSSFLNVISIRTKKIESKMPAKEKEAIHEAQHIYSLGTVTAKENYSKEDAAKIDEFDRIQKERKERKRILDQIAKDF